VSDYLSTSRSAVEDIGHLRHVGPYPQDVLRHHGQVVGNQEPIPLSVRNDEGIEGGGLGHIALEAIPYVPELFGFDHVGKILPRGLKDAVVGVHRPGCLMEQVVGPHVEPAPIIPVPGDVLAALGVVEWEMARVLIVCMPVAYWCGFHDGERFGEIALNVANESHSLRCK